MGGVIFKKLWKKLDWGQADEAKARGRESSLPRITQNRGNKSLNRNRGKRKGTDKVEMENI